MKVVVWGTYDTGKPRVRILIRGLRERGVDVIECHRPIWSDISDKSQVTGWSKRIGVVLRLLMAYPVLLFRYICLPRHDVVVCAYLGQFDLLVLWPFAKLRGAHLAWDAFLSLYNTVVEDRRLVGPRHPIARLLFALEWLDCRAADTIFTDTNAHGEYFQQRFGSNVEHMVRVFVGVEPEHFAPRESSARKKIEPFAVLFYGQFIPLHGIDVIVQAAKETESDGIRWRLIGKGQESVRIKTLIEDVSPSNLHWTEWVSYEELVENIHHADVCLGIFGNTDKARRVIPNKVFQVLSAGCTLVTGDSPAVRELLEPGKGIRLIPMADPSALADAVRQLRLQRNEENDTGFAALLPRITPEAVVGDLVAHLEKQALGRAGIRCP